MSKIFIIFSCFLAAKAVYSVEQNRASVIVDLYNKKLNFFDSFLTASGIDGLQQSLKNVSFETIQNLRKARILYTSLHRHIASWCIEVNDTADRFEWETEERLRQRGDTYASNVHDALDEMEMYFYHIEYLVKPLFNRSKSECHVTDSLKVLNGNVNQAKNIITEALSVINNATIATKDNFKREDIVEKCRPVLDKWNISKTGPTPSPSQKITPSPKDSTRVIEYDCRILVTDCYPTYDCQAVLSKSTLTQLVELYQNDKTVADFFHAINPKNYSSVGCDYYLQSFIRDNFLYWEPQIRKMEDTQSLFFSVYLDSNLRSSEKDISSATKYRIVDVTEASCSPYYGKCYSVSDSDWYWPIK